MTCAGLALGTAGSTAGLRVTWEYFSSLLLLKNKIIYLRRLYKRTISIYLLGCNIPGPFFFACGVSNLTSPSTEKTKCCWDSSVEVNITPAYCAEAKQHSCFIEQPLPGLTYNFWMVQKPARCGAMACSKKETEKISLFLSLLPSTEMACWKLGPAGIRPKALCGHIFIIVILWRIAFG